MQLAPCASRSHTIGATGARLQHESAQTVVRYGRSGPPDRRSHFVVNAQDQVAGSRWRLVALVLGTAVLASPALRDHDSFPLSTYPVYASARAREATFVTAHGRRVDGSIQRLSMSVIARTDDPLIAASRLAAAVAAGRVDQLCAEIAARAPIDLVAVEVTRERHDVVDGARDKESLIRREQLAGCAVPS
jgi:hypothetical protein